MIRIWFCCTRLCLNRKDLDTFYIMSLWCIAFGYWFFETVDMCCFLEWWSHLSFRNGRISMDANIRSVNVIYCNFYVCRACTMNEKGTLRSIIQRNFIISASATHSLKVFPKYANTFYTKQKQRNLIQWVVKYFSGL